MKAKFPDKLVDLLWEPSRYKVAYGGRGGAKSWNFARALLLLGVEKPMRILCARETMKSLADSVHRLLSDQIGMLELQSFYTIERARITGVNGTEFTFAGLHHNVSNIKSLEACDVAWVEEAQNCSRESFETLIPTIRKNDSEIWISFNPTFDDDPVYELFIKHPPPNARVVKVDWRDNPWFPEVLKQEMEHLKATDPDAYNHVYEGQCISLLASAIYANELRAVDREGRITRVPYDRSRPVDCYWDLGYGDFAACWMIQAFPFEYRCVDYIEDSQRSMHWFLEQLQARGYIYGTHWLPWDLGMHAKLMGGGKSIEQIIRDHGHKVRIVPKSPTIADGIEAARTVFPLCWFDRERCDEGIKALRHYRYGEVKTLQHVSRAPLHDRASHGSDAFRYFAIVAKPPKPAQPVQPQRRELVSAWS